MGIQGSFLIQFLQNKIFISSFVIEVSSATQENMQTVRRGLIPFERMNFCNLESQQDKDKDKEKNKISKFDNDPCINLVPPKFEFSRSLLFERIVSERSGHEKFVGGGDAAPNCYL